MCFRLPRNATLEEKKRLETHVTTLEDELEEQQATNDSLSDRFKRAQLQFDQLQAELNVERSNAQRSESQRSTLERQNKVSMTLEKSIA